MAESSLTAIAYYQLGLFTAETLSIGTTIVPGVAIGIPLGTYLIRRLDPEVFRRLCMSFDAWVVGFGLSRVLLDLELAQGSMAYGPLMLAIALDAWLLHVFFSARRAQRAGA